MTELHLERLQQAILAQNQSFLSIKELNQDFYVNVLKIPVRKEKEKEHLEKAKPLLAEIQELIDANVRRHIKWHLFRARLRETLLTSLVDIKRRLCCIASVDVRLFSL